MNREVHVRFCEGLGVKFPRATLLAGLRYVGESTGIETGQNLVITISGPHFAPISNMSVRHKIFSPRHISVL